MAIRATVKRTAQRALLLVCSAVAVMTVASCGGGFNLGGGSSGMDGSGVSTKIMQVRHVVILVLENLNYDDVVGSPSAPYINSLMSKGGLATHYYANLHPSIGNYFIITTGLPFSVDDGFSGVVTTDNVVRQLDASARSWKVYAQSLPQQGYIGGDVYPYLRRHNPISYFQEVQPPSTENMNIVDFSRFQAELSAGVLPAYSFVVPDAVHNAHDCPDGGSDCDVATRVRAADTWLSNNIAPLLANPEFQQSGLFILTTDESRDSIENGGGKVATVLVGTGVKAGYQGTNSYDHRSLLDLSMKALGLTNIPNEADLANEMTEFYQ